MEHNVSNLLLTLLTEARRGDLPYTEKKAKGAIDKVIVTLAGNESGKFTRLSKQFKELKDKTDELAKQADKLNAEIKEEAIDLFDATDAVYTRIVETVSMTINLSKRQPGGIEKTTKINFEQIIKEVTELVPGLKEQIDAIIAANTEIEEKVKEAKEPALRVSLKEDISFAAIVKFVKSAGRKLLSDIKSWGRTYDKKVIDLRTRIDALTNPLVEGNASNSSLVCFDFDTEDQAMDLLDWLTKSGFDDYSATDIKKCRRVGKQCWSIKVLKQYEHQVAKIEKQVAKILKK